MRKTADGRILYTAGDLVEFMASPFAAWMSRRALDEPDLAAPDARTAEDAIYQEQGQLHERAYYDKLAAAGRDIRTIPGGLDAAPRTLAAIREGCDVIYQAALDYAEFFGRADFLVRTPGDSNLGDWHYAIVDAKLARSARPDFLVQLCAYAEVLEMHQGVAPELRVVLGSNEELAFRASDFRWFHWHLRREFIEFLQRYDPKAPPDPEPSADHGRWSKEAERFFGERDHLVRVAGIRTGQIARLRDAGIDSLAALAATKLARVPRVSDSAFASLRLQAQLQLESRGLERPKHRVLPPVPPDRLGLAMLPPPSELDVYFDMEGYPLEPHGGLEYLFGAADARAEFHDWWAHDRAEEKRAFTDFVHWAHERWRTDPRMHIYHYAPYEVTALRKLMGRHAACEAEVDDLLRHEVFVDLYRVVRHGVRAGTEGYSLKDLETLYQEKRAGGVKTAGDSIVAYHNWRARNEPRDWRASDTLKAIRQYNCEDCVSLVAFTKWLRERQAEAGLAWSPPKKEEIKEEPDREDALLAREILGKLPDDPERRRIHELLAHLCEFHRREEKVFWWSVFDRCDATHEELAEDLECLGDLRREAAAPVTLAKSKGFRYRFDPDQDTKLEAGSKCAFSFDWKIGASIEELDRENGRVLVKVGPKALAALPDGPPPRASLIPLDYISSETLRGSILKTAREWMAGSLRPALDDFLARRRPRVDGPITPDIVTRMEGTTLVVQGPPGAGKTTNGARMILDLIAKGRRVGVTANSHEAILNLMVACAEQSPELTCLKVAGPDQHKLFAICRGARRLDRDEALDCFEDAPLVGATAYFFSREECEGKFDALFVDEAGQVSLGNLVAMSRAAKNLVLLGDPCQLAQPIQASHPGESGLSALDYFLNKRVTIPSDVGLFLGTTWRLHPLICRYVSDCFYEGRLQADASTEKRVIPVPAQGVERIDIEAGFVYVPVEHEGNTQSSEEEVEVVREIVDELRGRALEEKDILVVAPYNAQVRLLRRALPAGVRVGTVDKFQGQEAPAVILSMCTSDAEASPRGLAFLLSPNRLNVAISRARTLAIVVGSPALAGTRPSSVDEMRLLNFYARIMAEARPRLRR